MGLFKERKRRRKKLSNISQDTVKSDTRFLLLRGERGRKPPNREGITATGEKIRVPPSAPMPIVAREDDRLPA